MRIPYKGDFWYINRNLYTCHISINNSDENIFSMYKNTSRINIKLYLCLAMTLPTIIKLCFPITLYIHEMHFVIMGN